MPQRGIQALPLAGAKPIQRHGGCFDRLHAGHVGLLRQGRRLGDCLVVCLNSDASMRALKGPGLPLVGAPDRARVLAALEYVDAVLAFDEPMPAAVLDRLRPDVWVKGGDYPRGELAEASVVRRYGGEGCCSPTPATPPAGSWPRPAPASPALAGPASIRRKQLPTIPRRTKRAETP